MSKRVFEDPSGLYRLECAVAIHPLIVKGDRSDQTKVTDTHTAISTIGGQTIHTHIPYDQARQAFLELFDPDAAPKKTVVASGGTE
jgi:hypothetical protein